MKCPDCGSADTKVGDSRKKDGETVRKRVCEACGRRFTTTERVTAEYLHVRKRDGSIEPFSRAKLAKGITKAASVYQIAPPDVDAFVNRVIQALQPDAPNVPIPSRDIGRLVLQQLQGNSAVDVARIRYAMVLLGRTTHGRGFRKVEDFLEWLEEDQGPPQVVKPEATPWVVIKRNGRREPFQMEKLARSIGIAAKGRGDDAAVRNLALHVTAAVQRELDGQPLVTSGQIAAEALKALRSRDPMAYLRYASAVKRYRAIDDFWVEASGL